MNFSSRRAQNNPALEALRSQVLTKNDTELHSWIKALIKKTSTIHAGFLFQDLKILQELCLSISETQNKITEPGWQTFGAHLGLSLSLLKVIKHNNFTQEDPCYNVLLAYVQNDDASIGKLLEVLNQMGRFDVLNKLKEALNALADAILIPNQNDSSINNLDDTSDYESLAPSEGSKSLENDGSMSEMFLRPKVIPHAPLIFRNLSRPGANLNSEIFGLTSADEKATFESSLSGSSENRIVIQMESDEDMKMESERYCASQTEGNGLISKEEPRNVDDDSISNGFSKNEYKPSKKKRYGLKIFLTFAEDGERQAREIAEELRRGIDDYPAVGVLILKEHSETVNMDPLKFIEGAFHQVDYVCPIITPGYYRLITKQEVPNPLSHQSHMDAYYVPYIYRLMNSYFIANRCLNDKIRCIVSEDSFQSVPFKFLTVNPVLGAWIRLSEIGELAKRLLKSCKLID